MPDAIVTKGADSLLELGVAGVFILVVLFAVVYLERKATRREERLDAERAARDKENLESRMRSVEATNTFTTVTREQNGKIEENTKAVRDLTAQVTHLITRLDK